MKQITYIILILITFSMEVNCQVDSIAISNKFLDFVNATHRRDNKDILYWTYPKYIEKVGRDSLIGLLNAHNRLIKKEKGTTKIAKIITIKSPVIIKSEIFIPINFEFIGKTQTLRLIVNQWALAISDTGNIDWKFITLNQYTTGLFSEYPEINIRDTREPSVLEKYKPRYIPNRIRKEWEIDKETGDSCLNAIHYIYENNTYKDDNYNCKEKVSFSQTIDLDDNLIEYYIGDDSCYFYKFKYIGKDGYADSVCIYSSCKKAISIKYALKKYNKKGLLKKIIDIDGKEYKFNYTFNDSLQMVQKIITADNSKEIVLYKNNIIQSKTKSYLKGGKPVYIWTYNNLGKLECYCEGKYEKTVYEYDNNNNLISKTKFQLIKGNWDVIDEERFKYNERNELIEAKYFSGVRLIYFYKYEYLDQKTYN